MITYVEDDLFSTKDLYIAHGCNPYAVFGAGIALQIRKRFPWAYSKLQKVYEEHIVFNSHPLPLGKIYIAEDPIASEKPLKIINCITQREFGRKKGYRYVSYDAIDDCMLEISKQLNEDCCISMPKIGAGLGGGYWPIIEEIINFRLKDFNVLVFLGERNESLSDSKSKE